MIDTVNAARPRPHFRLRGDASRIEVTWLTSEGEDPYRVVEDPEVRRIDGHPYLQAKGDRSWGGQVVFHPDGRITAQISLRVNPRSLRDGVWMIDDDTRGRVIGLVLS